MGRKRDPETGKFLSKEEEERLKNVDTQSEYAIFASAGPGTSNFSDLTISMESAEYRTKENPGKKGHIIEFHNGQYKTKDPKEIEFLLWKCEHPIKYSQIKCIQLPGEYKDKESA